MKIRAVRCARNTCVVQSTRFCTVCTVRLYQNTCQNNKRKIMMLIKLREIVVPGSAACRSLKLYSLRQYPVMHRFFYRIYQFNKTISASNPTVRLSGRAGVFDASDLCYLNQIPLLMFTLSVSVSLHVFLGMSSNMCRRKMHTAVHATKSFHMTLKWFRKAQHTKCTYTCERRTLVTSAVVSEGRQHDVAEPKCAWSRGACVK